MERDLPFWRGKLGNNKPGVAYIFVYVLHIYVVRKLLELKSASIFCEGNTDLLKNIYDIYYCWEIWFIP